MAEAAVPRRRVRTFSNALRAGRFVYAAAPRELIMALLSEVVGAVALAGVLVFGRELIVELTADSPPDSVTDILPAVLGLAGSLLISGVALASLRELQMLVSELVVRRTQDEIVDVAAGVDFEEYERQKFHDLLDRANSRAAQSAYQMVVDMLALSNLFVTSIAIMAVMIGSVPQVLGVLVLVAVPFLIAARASARLAFQTTYALTKDDRIRFYLYRVLTSRADAREVRVFDLEGPLRGRWNDLYDERVVRVRHLMQRRILFNGLAAAAGAALVGGVLIVLVNAALGGDISLADAAVAIVALQQLSTRIRTASSSAGSLTQSALFLDEFEHFKRVHSSPPRGECGAEPLPRSTLCVEEASFVYPDTEHRVLHEICLEIGPGEVVALVGESGSGKTTLAHLIAGLYTPTSGSITYDGQDIREIGRARWWRSVATVFQDFSRYELTARENIAMGDQARLDDLEAVAAAAERADIAEELEGLSEGYETMLSRSYEGGAELSVGQWQRVAGARAFFRDAPLLILDEPAAALDARAEQRLHERVEELCSERSALVISHRFSTVRLADRICVMAAGRIVEQGTHDELVASGGLYAELFRLQARGYLSDAPSADERT